ncbi:MAG: amidohydrolase family protein [Flavobacteriales bacterium]|nr:amidohydrolase family protein [Flavobacteriales bacterium]MDW8409874.1 amidohydrolase family protein [Flavobacteriales bacterium]
MSRLLFFSKLFSFFTATTSLVFAQSPFAESYLRYDDKATYALVHVKAIVEPGKVLDNATLVWKDGVILSCEPGGAPPRGAVVMDGQGYWVYPGLVDLWADYGLPPEHKKEKVKHFPPPYDSERPGPVGTYESNRSDYQAVRFFHPDEKLAASYRQVGITAVLTHKAIGNLRGTAALVGTGQLKPTEEVIKSDAAFVFSVNKTDHIRQFYPTSLAGAIALIRQTFCDAAWYKQSGRNQQYFETLESFNRFVPRVPLICEVMDKYDIFRLEEVAREFGVQFIYKGSGNEYQRAEELGQLARPIVVPLQFPDPFDVRNPEEAKLISFVDLKHWELAPHNAVLLHRHGVPFAFTTAGLKKIEDLWDKIRQVVRLGLPPEEALRAFTQRPAAWLGESHRLGSLRAGALAHFFLASGDIFQKEETIFYTIVRGRVYSVNTPPPVRLQGIYKLEIPDLAIQAEVQITGPPLEPKMAPVAKDLRLPSTTMQWKGAQLTFRTAFPTDTTRPLYFWAAPPFPSSVAIEGFCAGPGIAIHTWKLTWLRPTEDLLTSEKVSPPGPVPKPFSAYGLISPPPRYDFVVRRATVWTNEIEGILPQTDVYVKEGKIIAVGKNLKVPPKTREIEAEGFHLTSGIIDEHSHIALTRGVNEWGSHASAEVRMADAIHPDDENIYRQLAGGVTAAQLLHGSANPIGGQSALVKFRWGALPQKMLIEGADNFIKFALGENVKQGNNPQEGYRFPQSRTGVEATFTYYFLKARHYGEQLKKNPGSVRRDLRLETLLRILENKCFITCHSYVQSEINMLMKLADSLGFKVNTFTHILEGYKVADKMKAHGAHASSFSDWWAYKWEVMEAIPYNMAILIKMGVNTAINSDDPEMARRLNQEAAKVVKYGGISEVEAWKTVTLNPAKMLHLEHRMGSIRPGKDADLVLWDGPPLSIYAKPLFTWVDGVEMFSAERDKVLREVIREERNRLIELMEKAPGAKEKPVSKARHHYHCDTLDEAWEAGTYD